MRPFGRPVSVGFFVPLTGTLCNVNSGRLEPGAAFFHTSPPSDESHPRWFQPTIIRVYTRLKCSLGNVTSAGAA